jgi:hypothetical protein
MNSIADSGQQFAIGIGVCIGLESLDDPSGTFVRQRLTLPGDLNSRF